MYILVGYKFDGLCVEGVFKSKASAQAEMKRLFEKIVYEKLTIYLEYCVETVKFTSGSEPMSDSDVIDDYLKKIEGYKNFTQNFFREYNCTISDNSASINDEEMYGELYEWTIEKVDEAEARD